MLKRSRLYSKNQTGRAMHQMIDKYYGDMYTTSGLTPALSTLTIDQAFDQIRKIPYRQDTTPIEVVARPAISLRHKDIGIDCKKKSILMASYLKSRGIPYRLIASSNKPSCRIHHVFPQMRFGNTWLNLDATYPKYRPFQEKVLTHAEVLNP